MPENWSTCCSQTSPVLTIFAQLWFIKLILLWFQFHSFQGNVSNLVSDFVNPDCLDVTVCKSNSSSIVRTVQLAKT